MLVLLLALWPVLALADSLRTTLPFSFGWRHYLGAPGVPQCTDPSTYFPLNYSSVQCDGLQGIDASTPDECAKAACGVGAEVWQWCTGGSGCGTTNCWAGSPSSLPCAKSSAWVGAGRNVPPTPPSPPPALPGFDDSAWEVVDAPHDALITTPYNNHSNNGQASIPKTDGWYRKHFTLPADWQGSHVAVYFEGAFSQVNFWLNGAMVMNHTCGYTSFSVRLDNMSGVVWGGENILALSTNNIATGWWYEGGGLFRSVYITRTSLPLHIPPSGVFAPSYLSGAIHPRATPSLGLTCDNATIMPTVSIENPAPPGTPPVVFSVSYAIIDTPSGGGGVVGTSHTTSANVSGGTTLPLPLPSLDVTSPELWSIPRPYLYTISVTLSTSEGVVVDVVNTTLGLRSVLWDPMEGAFINQQPTKLRGFCNHNNFAAVGMGVPDRINLFRLQQIRGVGGNSWRMSHNPGNPATFALGDRLGMTFLEENRVFSDQQEYIDNMRDMVRRDRVHPSILFYSFCNEGGCSASTEPTLDFKITADAEDGSRAVTMNYFWPPVKADINATAILDVQGFSHEDWASMDAFHERFPEKPLVATECCSCESQRAEDSDINHNATGNSTVFYTSYTQDCTSQQQHQSNGRAFVAGTYVWTAHDYYGEPGGWPHISSSFGQFDLAGFPKAPSYYYRSAWLSSVPPSDAARPPLTGPGADWVIHLVETWQPPSPPHTTRRISVYTNAPMVALKVNGGVVGLQALVPGWEGAPGWVTFPAVNFTPGVLRAEALAGDNTTLLAATEKSSWGAPAALVMSLDAPSVSTGTGAALYLDGVDVALVRVEVVDGNGRRVEDGVVNVTFTVTEGPGLVVGCGNGDPANHDPNDAPWKPAYHGLVRGIVRVTMDAASPPSVRAARIAMELDAGKGPRSSSTLPVGGTPPTSLTLQASSPGLPTVTLSIPLSVDPQDEPLSVASASVGSAYLG